MTILAVLQRIVSNFKLFDEFGIASASDTINPRESFSFLVLFKNHHLTTPHVLGFMNTDYIHNSQLIISISDVTPRHMTVNFYNPSDTLITAGEYNCVWALHT